MDLDDWLKTSLADAEQRGLADLRPLLETLARATHALRAADWNTSPSDFSDRQRDEHGPAGVAP